jgi:hypothetical protein
MKRLLSDWGAPTLLISGAYLLAFFLTFSAVMPLQEAVMPAFGSYASILFLPHGVLVIAAWLYGWRSLVFLVPGAILSNTFLFAPSGFSIDDMVALFYGAFCAALSFWILALVGMDFRIHKSVNVNWRDVMLAGVVASVVNSLGTKVLFGHDLQTVAAWFLGDITGMVVSVLILMLIFRWLRRFGGHASAR